MMQIILLLAFFLVLGGIAGVLAGLLGVGGGIVLVPGLYFGLSRFGFDPDVLMHMAVGTSLAVIVPTGFVSARTHWQHGAVRFDVIRRIAAGIVLGVVAGTFVADALPGSALGLIFALALMALAVVMALDPARFFDWTHGLAQPWITLAGSGVGALATLMGIGGATLSVPYLTICRVPIHQAVGTSSALGLIIAVPAALGFVLIGWGMGGRPPGSLGYINLLAWVSIVPASVLVAPFGARLAHRLPVARLRRIFAALMVIVALHMAYGVWHG